MVVTALTEQKAGQLLTSLTQGAHRGLARLHEITDRLMRLIWNPGSRQFAGSVQLDEVDRIPSVSLDPITGLARDQRRGDNDAFAACRRQLPSVAGGIRSRTDPPGSRTVVHFRRQPALQSKTSTTLACSRSSRVRGLLLVGPPRERNRDRLFMHVQSDVNDRPFHDPSPMHEARRRHPAQPSTTCIL
jgi:hypothetical protein